ncbi:MAG: hypothetical protein ACFFG0_06050 [Candidatus Thorarchaeota archaeon]
MNEDKYPIGYMEKSKKDFHLDLQKNTSDLIINNLIIDFMGGGKSNLLSSIAYGQFQTYIKTSGERGSLPIIFSPKFEYLKLSLPSKDDNIAPQLSPDSMDAIQITFPICQPPELLKDELEMRSIIFNDMTTEDIGLLAGITKSKGLGRIKKILKEIGKNYTIEQFIDYLENPETGRQDYSDLYYVYSTFYDIGLFDNEKYKPFKWEEELTKLKPIIINFGKMWDNQIQSLGGYLLRKLYELGDWVHDNVKLKSDFIKDRKKNKIESDLKFTEREKFLKKYFNLSLLIDEAPRLLTYTVSTTLTSYPANRYFQIISSNDGRKLGFRYNYVVTQFFADMYHKFRRRYRYIWFGNKVTGEDRDYITSNKILNPNDVTIVLRNKKFFFTVVDMQNYNNYKDEEIRKRFITRFKTYRCPCGVF